MNNKKLAEMVKRLRKEKLEEIIGKPGQFEPAHRTTHKEDPTSPNQYLHAKKTVEENMQRPSLGPKRARRKSVFKSTLGALEKRRYHLPDDKFRILFEIQSPLIFAEHPIFLNLIDILDKLKKDDNEVKKLLRIIKDHFIQYVEKEINIANLIYFTSIFMTNLLLLNKHHDIDLPILNEIKYYIDIIFAYLLNYVFTTQKLEYISSHVFPFKLKSGDPMTFNILLTTIQDKYSRLFNVDNQNKEDLITNIVDNASRIFGRPVLRPSRLAPRILKSSSLHPRN